MQEIKMNSNLIDAIKDGSKRATTRLGVKSKYHMGPVLITDASNATNIITDRYINKIELVVFGNISEELAALEGYSVSGLQEVLTRIYGPLKDNAVLTVIHFEFGR